MQGGTKTRRGRTRQGAGQGARAQARLIANRTFVKTASEQAWAQGAAGEEHVGELLDTLQGRGWSAVHDVKRGVRGASVDHVVVGPPGVFVLDTKCVSGRVWVAGEHIRVNTFPQNYLEKLEEQVGFVRERLLAATGRRTLEVQGLLVFVESQLEVGEPPSTHWVLSDDALLGTLARLPPRLPPEDVAELAQALTRRATWT